MRLASSPLFVSLALLSGCVQPPPVSRIEPVRPPTVAPPVRTPVSTPTAETTVAPGIWTYETDARGSRALFGMANTDALLVIRCDRAGRRIYVSVPGSAADTLTLRATTTLKGFAARPTAGLPAYVAAEIAPTDNILDALAFSRGRFTVGVGARQTTVPTWPEFTRVIEDCRA